MCSKRETNCFYLYNAHDIQLIISGTTIAYFARRSVKTEKW